MRFNLIFMVFLLLGAGIAYNLPVVAQEEVKVVTTLSFIGDVTKAILGNEGDVSALISGIVDPHNYEPSPSDLTALTEADLIITSGQDEFDGWFNDFLIDNPDLGEKVYEIDSDGYLEVDPLVNELNPHYWLSPVIMGNVSTMLYEVLNSRFQISDVGLTSFLDQLDELTSQISELRQTFEGVKVVVDHPAFFYFLDLLGIERVVAIEEKEGVDPSPSHIQALVDLMKEDNITQIVASKIQSSSDVIELATRTGAKISYLEVNPREITGNGYVNMMNSNIQAMTNPSDPTTTQNGVNSSYFLSFIAIFISASYTRRRWRAN